MACFRDVCVRKWHVLKLFRCISVTKKLHLIACAGGPCFRYKRCIHAFFISWFIRNVCSSSNIPFVIDSVATWNYKWKAFCKAWRCPKCWLKKVFNQHFFPSTFFPSHSLPSHDCPVSVSFSLSQDYIFHLEPGKVESGKGKCSYDPKFSSVSSLISESFSAPPWLLVPTLTGPE